MSTESLSRSLRNTGVCTVLLALFTVMVVAPALADEMTTMTTTTTTMGAPVWIDYSLLVNPPMNHFDIERARAYGLTDKQIGHAAALANYSGVPAETILNRLEDGASFSQLCIQYAVSLKDVLDNTRFDTWVHDYEFAYRHTGKPALRMANREEIMLASTTTSTPYYHMLVAGGHDIIRTARDEGNFHTFLRALKSTGLDKTLWGNGPFTVFAPTDSAFAKLPPGALDDLMANRDMLARILQYHVIAGQITASDINAMTSPTSPATLEGQTLQVAMSNGVISVNGANVVTPDIVCRNGVIHAIDTVLLPSDVTLPGWTAAGSGNMNGLMKGQ